MRRRKTAIPYRLWLILLAPVLFLLGLFGLTARAPAPLDPVAFAALYDRAAPVPGGARQVYHLGHSLVGRDMPAMLAQLAGPGHGYASQLGWGAALRSHWEPDVAVNGFETENAHPAWRDAHEAVGSGDYDALVLTIDNQLVGQRERDLRNGFTIPPRFSIADSLAMLGKLPWLLRMRSELANIRFGNYERHAASASLQGMAAIMPTLLDTNLQWHDIRAIREQWSGPFIIKGILHPEAAAIAIDHGVDGVIVSNHGGRQLDGAVPSLQALPDIAKVVDGKIPLLLDGGIRRGRDVLTALALGATDAGAPQQALPFFYGGYVRDPDGNKIGFVHLTPA